MRGGLSPLARGTLVQTPDCFAVRRFIPAGAGNSWFLFFCSGESSVYPRWRGELVLTDKTVLRFVGLSPLARGTRMIPNLGYRTSRFIPAGAGNSDLKIASQYWRAVYPRWRGELMKCRNVNFSSGGLSPLARGTQRQYGGHSVASRFIPAGAGNSRSVRTRVSAVAVYPRWRGELTVMR